MVYAVADVLTLKVAVAPALYEISVAKPWMLGSPMPVMSHWLLGAPASWFSQAMALPPHDCACAADAGTRPPTTSSALEAMRSVRASRKRLRPRTRSRMLITWANLSDHRSKPAVVARVIGAAG